MPNRFKGPIQLPTAVLDGLETVLESGEANMQDTTEVQAIATRLGYPETAAWIEDHPHEYQEGIFRGFVTARQTTYGTTKRLHG
jgi:Domain of unknown function (DUF5049)